MITSKIEHKYFEIWVTTPKRGTVKEYKRVNDKNAAKSIFETLKKKYKRDTVAITEISYTEYK